MRRRPSPAVIVMPRWRGAPLGCRRWRVEGTLSADQDVAPDWEAIARAIIAGLLTELSRG